ncbi:zinc ribbon domain-containing protein [Sulfoacidibacillus ferrooxidans]
MVKKDLSVRIHKCPACGLDMDRDVNAAINMLHRGLEILQKVS